MNMIRVKLFLIIGMLLSSAPSLAHEEAGASFPEIVKRVSPAIVGIATYNPLRSPRTVLRGTGFAILDGRYVVTNEHVIPKELDEQQRERISILVGKGRNPDRREARVILVDKKHDIALLEVSGKKIPSLKLAKGSIIAEGTEIGFTGFPIGAVLGLYPVTHKGIISAVTPVVIPQPTAKYLDPKIILQPRYDVYQLDATAYPGNSGSPIYDVTSGKVEGIINSVAVKGSKENVLSKPSGITYAIPVIYIYELITKAGIKQ